MAPQKKIEEPTPFAEWIKTEKLFDDGITPTRTHVINAKGGSRRAYGVSNEGFWFFIEMTKPEEENAFWAAYMKWRVRNATGDHAFVAYAGGTKPPTCGTPNTPPCGPNDLVAAKIAKLTEEVAGPTATPAQLVDVERRVIEMVVATLDGAIAVVKHGPS